MLDPMDSRFAQAAILSGLMDVEAVRKCWEAIPPQKREEPEHIDRRLARQALNANALTLWQAQQLLAGRTNGYKVDRYILLELIGQGGMGRVYLARDTRLNRAVALKILSPERISNPRAVARFGREARVGAQLQHENLVRVYDFGESNGRYFLVMEYIEGQTIGHMLSKRGPMPPSTAARLVRQVALGLAHAHRKGMIHRDVNPYNVLVTHEGIAKLADLGLAIDLSDGDRVTREGATVGTFDYVAPEQARHSHAADIRSDIYSLGCTLYHMLSGQVPFPSPSLPEKLFAHQAMEPAPLEQLVADLPAGLGDVVRTMMRKRPEERYATPMQVVQALGPYLEERPAAAGGRPEPTRGTTELSPPIVPASTIPDSAGSAAAPGGRTPSTSVVPASVLAAGPAPSPGPIAVEDGGGRAASGSGDFEESRAPLLTPVDDLNGSEEYGLSIGVDLGPEPSLLSTTSRSRPAPGGALASIFARTSSSDSPVAGAPAPSPSVLHRIPLPARVALAAVALAAVALAAVALASRLGPTPPPPGGKSGVSKRSPESKGPGRTTPRPHPPIVVRSIGTDEDGGEPVPTLADAVESVLGRGKDGHIELSDGAPLRLGRAEHFDLGSASGTIDIRAAAGARPVIEVEMDPGRPFLSTGSNVSLILSGVTIRARYPSPPSPGAGPPPPLIQAAGRVRIEECAFEADGPRPDGCRAVVADGVSLWVERCWFLGFDAAIRVIGYAETTAEIAQTMIVPGPGPAPDSGPNPELRGWAIGVQLAGGGAAASKRRLSLDHCTIEGAGLLEVAGDPGNAPMPVEVRHCAVRAQTLLAWKPRKEGQKLDADIKWEGAGNQFWVRNPSWVVGSAATMTPELSLGVTDLKGWIKFVSREDEAIPTRIKYAKEPSARGAAPTPRDLAIESSREKPEERAGANPEVVGPWARSGG